MVSDGRAWVGGVFVMVVKRFLKKMCFAVIVDGQIYLENWVKR